ncbi:endonuclease domain-containing protein [Flavobacterium sp. N1994]|uniref:endonuclease domain-containing protein n=1 Tax=Flavobacterium sp. N1994 TaxID=2986827 RepID=UPI0029CAC409|nr:endonuclease domain-containing protein [Flavobacterium sp. N1994]
MKKKIDLKNEDKAPLLFKEGCPKDGVVTITNPILSIHSLPHLKTFRTQLRSKLTPAEAYLWKELQKAKLSNRKFRRQHSIGNYIVDFYCPSEALAIELDGEVHNNEIAQQYDQERDLFLAYFNIKVVRFENKQVFENLDGVIEEIRKCFKQEL